MTHVQIADNIFDHPKFLSISPGAKLLAIAAICYSGNMLTDGFIPEGGVAVLAAKVGVLKVPSVIDELIAARLWDRMAGGYYAHDYLDYNPSAETILAKRAAARVRMGKGRPPKVPENTGGNSQNVRENFARNSDEQHANFAERSREFRNPTTTTTTSPTGDDTKPNGFAKNSSKKPLPENGQAQQIVAEFCRVSGIDEPAVYRKSVGQAALLAKAGITVADVQPLYDFVLSWADSADLGVMLSQVDKWRSSKHKPKNGSILDGPEPPWDPANPGPWKAYRDALAESRRI